MKHNYISRILSKIFISVLIAACLALSANAQSTAAPAAAKTTVARGAASYIEGFFKRFKASPDSAVDYLFNLNKLFTNAPQIGLLKTKLDSLQITFGKYLGKELITEKNASPSLVIYSYLVKFESQPIRFTFMFYKPQNDWVFYRFNYDDQMDLEMIEAVKINNKKY